MKIKLTLLELIILWLACNVAQNSGKVVGNINDADPGTLTIVDIEDENKTHYLNQNFELGNYNYGYDVKPNGPVGQFHHENRSPDEVVYGCYGYEGPDAKNYMTFYVSDAWGYRPVRQNSDIEIFYPADNPPGTGHMNGNPTKWSDLFFPDMCANMAERIASSSNIVTKEPLQPVSTPLSPADRFVTAAALPSTVSPAVSQSTFGIRNTPVPSSSFDVIQFNTPASGTIGPQPTSARFSQPASTNAAGVRPTSFGSTSTTRAASTADNLGQDNDSQFVTPGVDASSSNVVPNVPSSAATTAAGLPSGSRPTAGGISGGGRFPTATRGQTGVPSTATTEPLDITESLSSNDGPLTPNRRPQSPSTSTTGNTAYNGRQFSRLIPTPTEPSLNSEVPTGTGPTGQTHNNRFVTTRAPPTSNFNSLSRTTTTARPPTPAGQTESGTSTTRDIPPGRQPGRAGASYGASDDEDNLPGSFAPSSSRQPSAAPSTTSTRGPSRGTTSGFPSTNANTNTRNPSTTFGTTRNPTGASTTLGSTRNPPGSSTTLVTEPASPESTLPTDASSQPQQQSTFSNNPTFGTSPFPTTQQGSRGTGSGRTSTTGGFSGNFNNPSTLQPSSTNQQTVPGSTSGTPAATTTGQTNPNRFSTTFRQNLPTTSIPQGSTATDTFPPSSTTRGSSTFTSPSTFPPSTFAPLENVTDTTTTGTSNQDFCATQCSSCASTAQPERPTHPPTLSDEDFVNIPGALLSQIPVIFYPDCNVGAYQRPAIVPFCPSQQPLGCGSNQQPLTMRFPDASHFAAAASGHGPVARNAFVLNQGTGNRVTRKVRRGRQQRLANF